MVLRSVIWCSCTSICPRFAGSSVLMPRSGLSVKLVYSSSMNVTLPHRWPQWLVRVLQPFQYVKYDLPLYVCLRKSVMPAVHWWQKPMPDSSPAYTNSPSVVMIKPVPESSSVPSEVLMSEGSRNTYPFASFSFLLTLIFMCGGV